MAKRYDKGGKVSESDDVGTARARADASSVAQGFKDFGVPKYSKSGKNLGGGSGIERAVDTRNPEPRVSPLIQIYPEPRAKKTTSGSGVANYCKGGKVISSWSK